MNGAPFVSRREGRWEYATLAVEAIEKWNCAKGCVHGERDQAMRAEFGPGGACGLLAEVAMGEDAPIPELIDDGKRVTCTRRWPLPVKQGPPPPQSETLFDLSEASR